MEVSILWVLVGGGFSISVEDSSCSASSGGGASASSRRVFADFQGVRGKSSCGRVSDSELGFLERSVMMSEMAGTGGAVLRWLIVVVRELVIWS